MAGNSQLLSFIRSIEQIRDLIHKAIGEDLTPEQSVFQISEGRGNIAWLAGHLTYSFDAYIGRALGKAGILPSDYAELYQMGSKPESDPEKYPPLEEVLQWLDQVVAGLCEFLESQTDELLSRSLPEGNPVRERFLTVGDLAWFAVYHAGYHCGQITLLRQAQNLPCGFGV